MTAQLSRVLVLALGMGLMTSAAVAQSTVYATGFEAGDGIATGNLNGQNSWVVEAGGTATVTAGSGAQSSARFVQLGANSTITRAAASGSSQVLIRGYYQGGGSATLTAPVGGNPIAALIGFRQVDANNIAIAAWNGTTSQWTEPAGPVTFSNTGWHEIVIALDYTTKTFNVRVNGANHLQNLGFRDNSVSQLNGIGAGSETAARVDSIGLFASGANGDYDQDGWTDKFETAAGNSNPFAGTATTDFTAGNEPSLGNLNADGFHDAADYALLATAVANGTASVATGDMNGDGAVTVSDITHYGNRVAGTVSVMR